jgi:hypothetical protein
LPLLQQRRLLTLGERLDHCLWVRNIATVIPTAEAVAHYDAVKRKRRRQPVEFVAFNTCVLKAAQPEEGLEKP